MTNNKDTTKKLILLFHLSAWLIVLLLSWGVFARIMPIETSLQRAAGNTGAMALLFYGTGKLYQVYYETRAYLVFVIGLVLLFFAITSLRYFLNQQFEYEPALTPFYVPGPISFLIGALITNIGIVLNSLLYQLVRSRLEMQQRQTALVAEQRAASIQFLRTQMNPHFLFNTLNNIYSLAVVRSEKTAPLVLRLSELLKYVIYDTQAQKVALAKEIKLLEEYVELHQLQYEQPRNVDFSYPIQVQGIPIEPLLLIPLVENCFKHGNLAENAAAYIRLLLQVDGQVLTFITENTFNPRQVQKDHQGGVGLENIQRRLELEYPNRYRFEQSVEQDRFKVELKIFFTKQLV